MDNKGRITILVGINNSGKTSWAHEQWRKFPKSTIIINRQKIREGLFGYSEVDSMGYFKRDDTFSTEQVVESYKDDMINAALETGAHVIMDETHLYRGLIQQYKYWNVPTEIKNFNIGLIPAVRRDMRRTKKVGDKSLMFQVDNYRITIENINHNPIDFTTVNIKQNPSLPKCYVFGIDGTLAIKGSRNTTEWSKVSSDKVNYSVNTITDLIGNDPAREISTIICTGREGIALYETEKWLDNNDIGYDGIYIREKEDKRPDWVVKEEMWRKISERYNIISIFEDDLKVIRRAKSLGLKVFSV